jgi:RsiW-degrading membrane proteinase PrsW (M82 family)
LAVSDLINFGPSYQSVGTFLSAAGAFFGGLLVLPSVIYSFLRVIGRPAERSLYSRRWLWAILAVPVVIGIGYLVSQQLWLATFVLPWMHVLAIGIPALVLFVLVQQRLPQSSPQTNWGSLAIGLVMGPLLILVLEIAAVIVAFIILGLYIQQDPALMSNVMALSEQFSQGIMGLEDISDRLSILLSDPVLLSSVFALAALVIPLIEEMFKPIAVWLLLGRDLQSSDGFVLGVISGAGYAIFENLALSSSSGEEWTFIILARMGTTLLHMVTSGLVGWGIVMTFKHRKYLRFPLMYIVAVVMHSLWNGFVVSGSVVTMIPAETIPEILDITAGLTEYVLVGLSVLSLIIMISMNLILRRAIMSPASVGPDSAPTDSEVEIR